MKSKNFVRDSCVVGFALFAMFFGAGNLIFPPYLGFGSASNWFWGFAAFIITDIGLSLLALLMIAKKGKGAEGLTEVLGEKCSLVILFANTLCLGPLIAIPRTGATTFEFAVAPIFPSYINSWIGGAVFFALVIALSLKKAKIMDIIGYVLTPIMLLALAVLIIRGIFSPLGLPEISTNNIGEVFTEGIKAGYQTMDMMGAMIFSVTVLSTIRTKGYEDKKSQYKMITAAGLIASVGLLFVYCGLAFLGATVSTVFPAHLTQAELLIAITKGILGQEGVVLLGVIVAAACLTTAIGLVSSAADYFAGVFKGKISYKALVVIISLVSLVLSNFGISKIIMLASPVLDLIYPVLLVVTFLALFSSYIKNMNVYRFSALGAFLTSLLAVIERTFSLKPLTNLLPFSSLGFSWVLPALIFAILGHFVKSKNKEIV